jgi:DNA-binding XRE family transcriptional regulator
MAKRKIYPRPLDALAEAAGVSVWTLYKDEARGEPTVPTAKKVAAVLGIDWKSLFEDHDSSLPAAS